MGANPLISSSFAYDVDGAVLEDVFRDVVVDVETEVLLDVVEVDAVERVVVDADDVEGVLTDVDATEVVDD